MFSRILLGSSLIGTYSLLNHYNIMTLNKSNHQHKHDEKNEKNKKNEKNEKKKDLISEENWPYDQEKANEIHKYIQYEEEGKYNEGKETGKYALFPKEDLSCVFCKWMLEGPCGLNFARWAKCIDLSKESKVDYIRTCNQYTVTLGECVNSHPEYYEEDDTEEEYNKKKNDENKDIENESNNNNNDNDIKNDSKIKN